MHENDKTSKPAGFLFDQWSRYDAAARAIRAILPDGGSVLDVGCGEQMLLGSFLPEHQLTYLDPLLAGRDGEHVIGRHLTADTVPNGDFDVVVCVDALEHIPPGARRGFLEQIVRASKRGVVIAAPFADVGDAQGTDDVVNEAYRVKHGHDYSWLREHEEFGLPDLADTCAQLTDAGLKLTTFGNGHTPWLKKLLAAHVLHLDSPENMQVLRDIGDRFARDLMPLDHLEPTYRRIIVADRIAAPAVSLPPVSEQAGAAAWQAFEPWVNAQVSLHVDQLARTSREAHAQAAHKQLAHVKQVAELRAQTNAEITQLRAESEQLREEGRASRRRADDATAAFQAARTDNDAIKRSWSWRLSVPVRVVGSAAGYIITKARGATLRVAQWCAQSLVPESLRWPIKNAFFTALRPLLKNSREYVDFLEAKRWRDRPAPPPVTVIAPPHNSLPDVLVFGVIDWQLRIQRPQQLALELARRGHRVLYLSPSFVHTKLPGYAIAHLAEDLAIY